MSEVNTSLSSADENFWIKEIDDAKEIYDLFAICDCLIEDFNLKVEKDDIVLEIAAKMDQYSENCANLFLQIDERLHEFGGQNIPYDDWHWEVVEEQ